MKIEVNDFTKIISKARFLENINICLEGGNIYGIIGRNGSGKTMFFRMILVLYYQHQGWLK